MTHFDGFADETVHLLGVDTARVIGDPDLKVSSCERWVRDCPKPS